MSNVFCESYWNLESPLFNRARVNVRMYFMGRYEEIVEASASSMLQLSLREALALMNPFLHSHYAHCRARTIHSHV